MTSSVSVFSSSYGELEAALAAMCAIEPAAVRARFRLLRLHVFPDAIREGAGSRVRYDLPRMLACAAVFALVDGRLPQRSAMELVRATWPEWCRAFLVAAVQDGLISPPEAMPNELLPVLRIMPDGWPNGATSLVVAVVGDVSMPTGLPVACRLVDCRAMQVALRGLAGDLSAFIGAAASLATRFGWAAASLPFRGDVRMMPPAGGFLDDGPYFARALALLDACDRPHLSATLRWRLAQLMAYLERPAPIDAWKREIGRDGDRPRLHHLLTFRAAEMGILSFDRYPEVTRVCGDLDVSAAARRLIADAHAQRGIAVSDEQRSTPR